MIYYWKKLAGIRVTFLTIQISRRSKIIYTYVITLEVVLCYQKILNPYLPLYAFRLIQFPNWSVVLHVSLQNWKKWRRKFFSEEGKTVFREFAYRACNVYFCKGWGVLIILKCKNTKERNCKLFSCNVYISFSFISSFTHSKRSNKH